MGFGMPEPRQLVLAEDLWRRGQKLKARNAIIPAEPTEGLWRRDVRIATEPEDVEWAPGQVEKCCWIISERTWFRWSLLEEDPIPHAQPWPLRTIWIEV